MPNTQNAHLLAIVVYPVENAVRGDNELTHFALWRPIVVTSAEGKLRELTRTALDLLGDTPGRAGIIRSDHAYDAGDVG